VLRIVAVYCFDEMIELTIVSHSDSEATASAIQYYCTRNKLQQIVMNIKAKIINWHYRQFESSFIGTTNRRLYTTISASCLSNCHATPCRMMQRG